MTDFRPCIHDRWRAALCKSRPSSTNTNFVVVLSVYLSCFCFCCWFCALQNILSKASSRPKAFQFHHKSTSSTRRPSPARHTQHIGISHYENEYPKLLQQAQAALLDKTDKMVRAALTKIAKSTDTRSVTKTMQENQVHQTSIAIQSAGVEALAKLADLHTLSYAAGVADKAGAPFVANHKAKWEATGSPALVGRLKISAEAYDMVCGAATNNSSIDEARLLRVVKEWNNLLVPSSLVPLLCKYLVTVGVPALVNKKRADTLRQVEIRLPEDKALVLTGIWCCEHDLSPHFSTLVQEDMADLEQLRSLSLSDIRGLLPALSFKQAKKFEQVLKRKENTFATNEGVFILQKNQIIVGPKIGEGNFGIVHKGSTTVGHSNVAVKLLRNEPAAALKEVQTMSKLARHPNLLRIIGMCPSPFMLVTELAALGNLKSHLDQVILAPNPFFWLWFIMQ